jgi:class 3 adenylate cyclase
MTCTSCGGPSAETHRFCASCGAPLGPGAGPQESRKTVSVLFLDIVGSTTLAERLDPEPLRRIMDRYFTTCAASVAAHGGVVEKFTWCGSSPRREGCEGQPGR